MYNDIKINSVPAIAGCPPTLPVLGNGILVNSPNLPGIPAEGSRYPALSFRLINSKVVVFWET